MSRGGQTRNCEPGFHLSDGRYLRTTPVFDIYWHFAAERQHMFCRRAEGEDHPWTEDEVLKAYRFTNAYRASDRVSQFLIRHVIYEGDPAPEEVFFRTVLFKLFNRIETWTLLCEAFGPPVWRSFNLEQYNRVLTVALEAGKQLYSGAYIMPSPPFGSKRKHTNHLLLLNEMMISGVPRRVATAGSLEEVFLILLEFPSIGTFLAYQYAIDLNYSELTRFSEMEFVVAGPGARSGIRKAFVSTDGLSAETIIREVTLAADREFAFRGLRFRRLWGRPLQLIDCQNLFCEVDKYTRVVYPTAVGDGRTRMKRRFSTPNALAPQWYPPKWSLHVGAKNGADAYPDPVNG